MKPASSITQLVLAPIGGVCAAVSICAVFAHAGAMRSETRAAHKDHLLAVAVAGASAIQPAGPEHGQLYDAQRLERWSWATISDPAIIATAVIGPTGDAVAVHPADADLGDAVAQAIADKVGHVNIAGSSNPADLVVREIDTGCRLVLLGRPPPEPTIAWARSWPFLATLVIGMGLLFGAATMLVRRHVVKPLDSLTNLTEASLPRQSSGSGQAKGVSFGRLANGVARLIEDARRSRARASRLKRTMDARVTHETREIEAMLRRAEREAWFDPLTRLGNRRLLDDRLADLVSDQLRRGEDLSLIVLDLDNFKGLNDALGHTAGDELLRFVGQLLRGSLRGSDIGLRLGGDEFAIVLLGADLEEACQTADRVITLFGQRASQYSVSPRVTMSAGVGSLVYHQSRDAAALLSAADAGLYRAKRAGKARVGVVPRTLTRKAPVPSP